MNTPTSAYLLIADKCRQFVEMWPIGVLTIYCYICRNQSWHKPYNGCDILRVRWTVTHKWYFNQFSDSFVHIIVTIKKNVTFSPKFIRIPKSRKWLINRSIVHCVVVDTRICVQTNKQPENKKNQFTNSYKLKWTYQLMGDQSILKVVCAFF